MWSQVGKDVCTQDPEKVDTSKGVFGSVSLNDLASFLADPITSAMFLQMYFVLVFKEYAIEDCVRMLEDRSFNDESTGSTFVEDTLRLPKRSSGKTREGGRARGCSRGGAESAKPQREAGCLKPESLRKEWGGLEYVPEWRVDKTALLDGSSEDEGRNSETRNFSYLPEHATPLSGSLFR